MRLTRRLLLATALLVVGLGPPAAADDGGARFFGSTGGTPLNAPVVGMARMPAGDGYWLVASDGGVFSFGSARFHGSTGAIRLNRPVVGMAAAPDGAGYWIVASDGGVFAFGSARFHGSTGAIRLNAPIVGMAASGQEGYWLVASDGGVFAFGSARFHGSTGAIRLNQPVVGMAAGPTGSGYWLVASDGGVFAFGEAVFHGSTGGVRLNRPVVGMAATPTGGGYWLVASDGGVFAFPSSSPTVSVSVVASGLTVPWDIGFTPDGTLLYTERPGRIGAVVGGTTRKLLDVPQVAASGEGGLLGLAVDPEFASNRRIYVCQNWSDGTQQDVRLYAYTLDAGYTTATRVATPLFSGAPMTTGRHSGCRPRFGPDGYLWVGTGDAATGTVPQDLGSLGGKVLRIDKATGAGVPGNLTGRILTYGHRNVQGLAVRPGGQVYAAEHGPDRDDEVTRLRAGGNGGWDPTPGYNESVPMTDLAKFPGAMRPTWTSGLARMAPSGAAFVSGSGWKSWSGALMVAFLRGTEVRALFLDGDGRLLGQQTVYDPPDRLRAAELGPDGSLYVTTSNGANDRILRLTPT